MVRTQESSEATVCVEDGFQRAQDDQGLSVCKPLCVATDPASAEAQPQSVLMRGECDC